MSSYIDTNLLSHTFNILLIITLFAFSWIQLPHYMSSRRLKQRRREDSETKKKQVMHDESMKRIGNSLSTLDKHIQTILTKESETKKCRYY